MSVRAARRLLFLLFAVTLPLPMLGPFDALVPALRYLVLLSAAGALALAEGAAGPVPALLALFAVNALSYLVLAWLLAWLGARALARLSPGARRACVFAAWAVLLCVGIALELYRTPFGRAPTANLFGALW